LVETMGSMIPSFPKPVIILDTPWFFLGQPQIYHFSTQQNMMFLSWVRFISFDFDSMMLNYFESPPKSSHGKSSHGWFLGAGHPNGHWDSGSGW
jgi:hypothetical protein